MRPPVPDRDAGTSDRGSSDPEDPPHDSSYWRFYEQVAARHLMDWAPGAPARVLHLTGPRPGSARDLVAAGLDVVQVLGARCPAGPAVPAAARALADRGPAPRSGRLLQVRAEAGSLGWLADRSVDGVLAESQALALCLATELVVADLFRVLRPGGRLLLVVDSLGLGLARLAEQGRWAELADVPSAEVLLVPRGDSDPGTWTAADGGLTRCFWPEELRVVLAEAGFVVESVRPRTVLAPAAVERALAHGTTLATLVATELTLEGRGRPDDGRHADLPGQHLVALARRPG